MTAVIDHATFADLVRRFEETTLPRTAWDHRAHLTVAAWYLLHHPEGVATERIISGIQRYNHAHGIETTPTSGYHETMTLFWIAMVRKTLGALTAETSVASRILAVLDTLGARRDAFLEYYSKDRIMSVLARRRWVEPDLRPLSE